MKNRNQDAEMVGSLFDAYFRSIGQLTRYKYELALNSWPSVVGQRVAAHTAPVRCDDGVLMVHVDSPAWHNELQYMKRDIVTRLNQNLGGMYIKELLFSVTQKK